jgi:hypothetical protein
VSPLFYVVLVLLGIIAGLVVGLVYMMDASRRRGPVQTIRELPSCRTYTGGWSRR